MGRKQKNTVNHFLNKRLKPKISEDGLEEYYPVYLTIRAFQQQTQLKSFFWLFQINSIDRVSNWDKFNYIKNDTSLSYITNDQFVEEGPYKAWMNIEASYFLNAVTSFSNVLSKEIFDVKLIGRHLFDLTIPLHLIISEHYKYKLKNSLTEAGQIKLVGIIDWHWNTFWDIMSALISVYDGLIFQKTDIQTSYQVLNKYVPSYLIINDLFASTSKKVIWILDWSNYLMDESFLDFFRNQISRNVYSKEDFKNFLSEIGAEVNRITNNVLIEDLI